LYDCAARLKRGGYRLRQFAHRIVDETSPHDASRWLRHRDKSETMSNVVLARVICV